MLENTPPISSGPPTINLPAPTPGNTRYIEALLGISFSDSKLLQRAITDTTFEPKYGYNFNSFAYIGDAIIYLTEKISRLSSLVNGLASPRNVAFPSSNKDLVELAKSHGIHKTIRYKHQSVVMQKPDYLSEVTIASVFEAILGAIYLDRGLPTAISCTLKLYNTQPTALILPKPPATVAPTTLTMLPRFEHDTKHQFSNYELISQLSQLPRNDRIKLYQALSGLGLTISNLLSREEIIHEALSSLQRGKRLKPVMRGTPFGLPPPKWSKAFPRRIGPLARNFFEELLGSEVIVKEKRAAYAAVGLIYWDKDLDAAKKTLMKATSGWVSS